MIDLDIENALVGELKRITLWAYIPKEKIEKIAIENTAYFL
jgi:hypothetical protein